MDKELLEAAVAKIRRTWPEARPAGGFILGSGWSDVIGDFEVRGQIAYQELPGLGRTSIVGHAGTLSWVTTGGKEFFLFQGRRHWYEGVDWTPIALPLYVMKSCGCGFAFLTNAAGGITPDLAPGDLMVLNDHINLMGVNPLRGPHDDFWGPRYPDLSNLYDAELRSKLLDAARGSGSRVKEGVYLAVQGPSFETPAEIRMMRTLGADAVGMSTVPEAILAAGAGLRVVGLSCITNFAAGISQHPLTHQEVIETTAQAMPRMRRTLVNFCQSLR